MTEVGLAFRSYHSELDETVVLIQGGFLDGTEWDGV